VTGRHEHTEFLGHLEPLLHGPDADEQLGGRVLRAALAQVVPSGDRVREQPLLASRIGHPAESLGDEVADLHGPLVRCHGTQLVTSEPGRLTTHGVEGKRP